MIGYRLKAIREKLNLSQEDFAKNLSIGSKTLWDYENNKSPIKSNVIEKLVENYDVNASWVFSGGGEPFLSSENSSDDLLNIKIYPNISGSMGQGSLTPECEKIEYLKLSKVWLKHCLKVSPQADKLHFIFGKGDSMEPTICDGDLLLIDERQIDIQKSGIYAIKDSENLYVKRIQVFSNKLELISDNPHYKPREILKSELDGVEIVGRVIWNGNKTLM